jgi:ethanolamine utilization microcompartment shell protein EutS
MTKHRVYRSAITGRYVTAAYAAQHPDTTIAQTVGAVRKTVAALTLALRGGS